MSKPFLDLNELRCYAAIVDALCACTLKGNRLQASHFEKAFGESFFTTRPGHYSRVATELTVKTFLSGPGSAEIIRFLRDTSKYQIAQEFERSRLGEAGHSRCTAHELNSDAFWHGEFSALFVPSAARREALRAAGADLAGKLAAHPSIAGCHRDRTSSADESSATAAAQRATQLLVTVGVSLSLAAQRLAWPQEFLQLLSEADDYLLATSGLYLRIPRAVMLAALEELEKKGLDMDLILMSSEPFLDKLARIAEDRWRVNKLPGVNTTPKYLIEVVMDEIGLVDSCFDALTIREEQRETLPVLARCTGKAAPSSLRTAIGESLLRQLRDVIFLEYRDDPLPHWRGYGIWRSSNMQQISLGPPLQTNNQSGWPDDVGPAAYAIDTEGHVSASSRFCDNPFLQAGSPEALQVGAAALQWRAALCNVLADHSEVLLAERTGRTLGIVHYGSELFILSGPLEEDTVELLKGCGWNEAPIPDDVAAHLGFDESFSRSLRYALPPAGTIEHAPSATPTPPHQPTIVHHHRAASPMTAHHATPLIARRLTFEEFRSILEEAGASLDYHTGGEHPAKFKRNGRTWPVSKRFMEWDAIFPNMLHKAATTLGIDHETLGRAVKASV